MTRFIWAVAALAGLTIGTERAAAQGPYGPRIGAPPPPASSPYLNLIRGNRPAVNYYGIVRPQQNMTAAIQTLQAQQMSGLSPVVGGQADGSDLPGTGVPVQFMNHFGYFMNMGSGGGGSFGTGMPGRATAGGMATMSRPPARGR